MRSSHKVIHLNYPLLSQALAEAYACTLVYGEFFT